MINSRNIGAQTVHEFASVIYQGLGINLKRNLEQTRSGGHDPTYKDNCPTSEHINQFTIEVKRYRQAKDADVSR